MKAWISFAMAAFCAGMTMAQTRSNARGKGAAAGGEDTRDQTIVIKEITGVGGDSDYLATAPQTSDKWKMKLNHKDTYKTGNNKVGWHFFEVAYKVGSIGTDASGAKKPILVLPEVEVTYALLYDMTKAKHAAGVASRAKAAGGAIGWDNPKQLYPLLTETITYTNITPDREHYAAVCVPPSFVASYGTPMVFSVQIKVNGVQQGDIKTEVVGGAKIGTNELATILKDKATGKPAAWWERIQNLSDSVFKVDGILRDRSETPFIMVGDLYYDQVKTK